MPYDITVRRGAEPISTAEIERVLAGGNVRKRPDAWWVSYPQIGEPWCAACLRDGALVLSSSYSNHRFMRNFPNAFDLALRLAQILNAEVFDEDGQQVTRDNIDGLLRPDGPLIGLQHAAWRKAQEDHWMKGPLEFPLGSIDFVPEYFFFSVTLPRALDWPQLLGPLQLPHLLFKLQDRVALVAHAERQRRAARMQIDGSSIIISPSHGEEEFAGKARATLELVDAIEARHGGQVTFLQAKTPFVGRLRSEVAARASGLGVDFWEWVSGNRVG